MILFAIIVSRVQGILAKFSQPRRMDCKVILLNCKISAWAFVLGIERVNNLLKFQWVNPCLTVELL